jgi:hypothetical protein
VRNKAIFSGLTNQETSIIAMTHSGWRHDVIQGIFYQDRTIICED